ncbi:hypothetical protein SKAU_G00380370 [Synaphobranchus kaupii]|uniref:Uncharacterized protein n=1 Tax=Synaphobranchus kaupii TaxID=118154 RepID=A0A9Q1EDI6_SYNKA|nr:hypothetical protein SKAU_G00380370 [Synaphobranchus kaupii]
MWAAFGHIESIPPLAFALPAVFAKSSTLYNPAIYLLLRPNFRKVMRQDVTVLQRMCLRNCLCTKRLARCDSNTIVKVSAKERGSAEQKEPPKTQQTAKKTVRVFVRGKRNAEIDCLEISLEAMPAQAKTAWQ